MLGELTALPMQATEPTWRLLADRGPREPRANLALEEALARMRGDAPALRLWRNRRCVVLGRFQVAEAEVDGSACRALGVPVYRRFTGGGAVYHDEGNLNVSLVLPRGDPLVSPARQALPGLYRLLLDPLADALRSLGLDAAGDRDLRIAGRKLSGVAAWLGQDSVLVHATLLVDADLDTLERVLAGPGAPGNVRWLRTRSRRAEVTSLEREGVPQEELDSVERRVVKAVAELERQAAQRDGRPARVPAPAEPTGLERQAMLALLGSRYRAPAWHATGEHGEVIDRAHVAA